MRRSAQTVTARWQSGDATDCKSVLRRFDSGPSLQSFQALTPVLLDASGYYSLEWLLFLAVGLLDDGGCGARAAVGVVAHGDAAVAVLEQLEGVG